MLLRTSRYTNNVTINIKALNTLVKLLQLSEKNERHEVLRLRGAVVILK